NGNLLGTADQATVTIQNGLILNGTMTMGSGNMQNFLSFRFPNGPQPDAIGGTGSIVFDNNVLNTVILGDNGNQTVTIGPGITVQGGSSTSGGGSLANQGLIQTSGRVTFARPLTNSGTLEADAGGTINVNSSSWTNTGTVFANGGTVNINSSGTSSGTITAVGGAVNFNGSWTES